MREPELPECPECGEYTWDQGTGYDWAYYYICRECGYRLQTRLGRDLERGDEEYHRRKEDS